MVSAGWLHGYMWPRLTYWPVIKLKQVEHVRNERKTLAAVTGHPFITTLVASFSDEQTLYMLVWLRVSISSLCADD